MSVCVSKKNGIIKINKIEKRGRKSDLHPRLPVANDFFLRSLVRMRKENISILPPSSGWWKAWENRGVFSPPNVDDLRPIMGGADRERIFPGITGGGEGDIIRK